MRRPHFRAVLLATIVLGGLTAAAGVVAIATGHRSAGVPVAVFAGIIVVWSYLHYWREKR